MRTLRWLAPVMMLAAAAPCAALAQSGADRRQEVETALDQYGAAKTYDQRATVIEFLFHLNRAMVASAVVDHILDARTGLEATTYNDLIPPFAPDGCNAVLDRLKVVQSPTAKAKLIVALRHCRGVRTLAALEALLDDKRPVPFEAKGPLPRRVCDLAYDDLYLKLRKDPRLKLDPTPAMKGYITETVPEKKRDVLIWKLKTRMIENAPPAPAKKPKPAASATPA